MLTAADLGADLTRLAPEQKVAIVPLLFDLAPGTAADTLDKRRWVAARLTLPLKEVNRALWRAGVKWLPSPAKQPKLQWVSRRKGRGWVATKELIDRARPSPLYGP